MDEPVFDTFSDSFDLILRFCCRQLFVCCCIIQMVVEYVYPKLWIAVLGQQPKRITGEAGTQRAFPVDDECVVVVVHSIGVAAVSDFEKNAHRKLRDARDMLAVAKRLKISVPPSTLETMQGVRK